MSVLALPVAAGVLLYEPFEYAVGTQWRAAGGWRYQGMPAPDALVIGGNLSIPGLAAPQGNMVSNTANVGTAVTYVYTNMTSLTSPMALTAFYSFAVCIQSPLGPSVSNLFAIGENDYHIVRVRANANVTNNFDIGLGQTPTVSVVWDTNGGDGYPPGPTNFLVMAINLTTPGASVANALQLWYNPAPATFGQPLPPVPLLATAAYTASTYTNRVRYLRFYRTQGATVYLDEIRAGTSWADVTPSGSDEITRPVNLAPTDGELASLTPTLAATAFVSSPSNIHVGSEYSIRSTFGTAQWLYSTGPVTNFAVPAATLSYSSMYRWQVRYLGTFSTSFWSIATTFQTLQSTSALLVAYDGAAYPETTDISGFAGGQGWSNAWTNVNHGVNGVGVRLGGMSYPGLFVTGETFITADPADSPLRATRIVAVRDGMAHLLTPAGKLGRAGSTNWFAFLVAAGEDFTNGEYGVEILDGASRRAFVTKSQDLPRWWLAAQGTNGAGCTFEQFSTNVQWLVWRIAHATSGTSNGTAHLWINPAVGDAMPADNEAAIVLYAVRPFTFDRMAIFANAWPPSGPGIPPVALIDELRFGDDWLSLSQVPEPALTLAALAGVCVIARRHCTR
jgi:hypothetical protein